jgi:hypothetical protein
MMIEQLIGKKVRVLTNDRDFSGKLIPNKLTPIVGVCTFAGRNEMLDIFQITIDRTPIFPIQFKDVEILD